MTGGTPAGGYQVYVDALRGYSDNVRDYEDQSSKFSDLISQADVGDESWGVVGIFTKSEYTESLTQLVDLVEDMKAGLRTLSYKIKDAADVYDGIESDHETTFGGILAQLDGPLG